MKTTYYYVAGAIIVIAIALFLFSNNMAKDATTTLENAKTEDPTELGAVEKGSYEIYSPEKVTSAEGKVVLFFHASWCPSCRGLNTNLQNNLNNIPSDLSILKLDYDKETELKKKYGVTTQHTLVQVDKQGNLIKKWSGGSSLEALMSQIV